MSLKVTKNQKIFAEEVPSESVETAKSYRGERKSGDDDDVESSYFEFQNNQERQEILNDLISSETKRSYANKLYEVSKKVELEESVDTLSSRESNEKEKVFRSELGFNNNAEGYSPPKDKKNILFKHKKLEKKTLDKLTKISISMEHERENIKQLEEEKRALAFAALQKAFGFSEMLKAQPDAQPKVQAKSSMLQNFISGITSFLGCESKRGARGSGELLRPIDCDRHLLQTGDRARTDTNVKSESESESEDKRTTSERDPREAARNELMLIDKQMRENYNSSEELEDWEGKRNIMTESEKEQDFRDRRRCAMGSRRRFRRKKNYVRMIPEGEDDDDVFE